MKVEKSINNIEFGESNIVRWSLNITGHVTGSEIKC